MAEDREHFPTPIYLQAGLQRDLIDRAADYLGRSRDGFVLDAASRQAEDVLLDQVFFPLGDRAFAEFQALVQSPPPPGDRLSALMRSEAPWG